jgi:hypothetical protein
MISLCQMNIFSKANNFFSSTGDSARPWTAVPLHRFQFKAAQECRNPKMLRIKFMNR